MLCCAVRHLAMSCPAGALHAPRWYVELTGSVSGCSLEHLSDTLCRAEDRSLAWSCVSVAVASPGAAGCTGTHDIVRRDGSKPAGGDFAELEAWLELIDDTAPTEAEVMGEGGGGQLQSLRGLLRLWQDAKRPAARASDTLVFVTECISTAMSIARSGEQADAIDMLEQLIRSMAHGVAPEITQALSDALEALQRRDYEQPSAEPEPEPEPEPASERPPAAPTSQGGTWWWDAYGAGQQRDPARVAAMRALGLNPEQLPSRTDLKQAFRSQARRWHPDRPHNHSRLSEATDRFQGAKEAFDRLSRDRTLWMRTAR